MSPELRAALTTLDLRTVRKAATRPNLPLPIDWEVVDPLLQLCTEQGGLKQLAKLLGISLASLQARRKGLGLPPMPRGRPETVQLTMKEMYVSTQIREGRTMTDIATSLGVSRQSVGQIAAKAKFKTESIRCRQCDGLGLLECIQSCTAADGSKHDVTQRDLLDMNATGVYLQKKAKSDSKRSGRHFHVCPRCNGDTSFSGAADVGS